ncbi:site-specific integrase [Proteus mirabilis]|uniref:site-specific integrase n=1 Tax=Proteus mirabilis TaxID=584 RepID=UPI001A2861FB|nr:site-specific integrase [Proteus mirabilis]MBI6282288.1 phage integrase Arm DNA-binding domain-containing protein [Proteus mirabilis]MDF7223885.1 site-specific integrase [Proteus mirabilis]MDF7262902.1 site-specific integrase [Proteus mirabilis]MDF7310710.1 site-specific integrase [Proteus mirabilis]MDF7364252.1 site-specific integrase [Proteus mirabilis]
MSGRLRKKNIDIPNLYSIYHPRMKKIYWRYRHPISGKFHSLGDDEAQAKQIALEANNRIAEQRTRQILIIGDRVATMKDQSISVSTWLDRYWNIQKERLSQGEIKLATYKQKKKPIDLMRQKLALYPLANIGTRDLVSIIDEYKAIGQMRMAQVVRSVFSDIFKEAQHAGEVPPGYNPALATKRPRTRIRRQRLTLDEWHKIYDIADKQHRYMGNAMLLALITGQRLGDISAMKFSDIWDDHLHIIQEKTGTKLAIPLSLRSEQLNMSLREVVARCRDRVISPYLIHYFHTTSQSKRGEQVTANTLTTNFKKARNKTDIDWGEGTPATFHEQRSLSERLYRAQGINTKDLLGHKNQIQTDKYHDDRGKDWIKIVI